MIETQSPPAVSRYRTQRKPRHSESSGTADQNISSQQAPSPSQIVSRSKSRYHRPATASSEASPPAITTNRRERPIVHQRGRDAHRGSSNERTPDADKMNSPDYARLTSSGSAERSKFMARQQESSFAAGDEEKRVDSRAKHLQALQSQHNSSIEQPRAQSHRVQPQHARDAATHTIPAQGPDGPPASRQIRATRSSGSLSTSLNSETESAGCFGLFKRKRNETSEQHSPTIPSVPPIKGPTTIKVGGGGIVPGTDAPVSAVNAGDRCVLVESGKSKMLFPVTPETTPVDLIKSAATVMSETIDVHSAVLLEYFDTVGVARPLRRYEHVRDVLNSWDSDKQNKLSLVAASTAGAQTGLSVSDVPSQRPADTSWVLLYSQKPGKWDRRTISVKSDGQVTSMKDANKLQASENICHLSDFDIYTPTQDKVRKKVKPPKRYCFAVKSQQKTSMFESTQNFVHFFSTGDRSCSEGFYSAVQSWRSWYLVNVLGEGQKSVPVSATASGKPELATKGHRAQESFSSHYQLGSFQPLLEPAQFDAHENGAEEIAPLPSAGHAKDTTHERVHEKQPSIKHGHHHPLNAQGKEFLAEDEPLANLNRRLSRKVKADRCAPDKNITAKEFASAGLLGNSYSQRRRDVEIQAGANEINGPWVNGPNLLNTLATEGLLGQRKAEEVSEPELSARQSNMLHRRLSSSEGRVRQSSELAGTNARTDRSKPLIDLTPQYRKPPQHLRKGRGHKPEALGLGGLIESATSPDDPMGVPSSTDWRARPEQGRHRGGPIAQPLHCPAHSHGSGGQDAFAADGLLSQGQTGWGGGECGRGVMDGSHAKGPMLDMTESSKFVHGSLLNHVELVQGKEGPVIDREKRSERMVMTGEGF